ncbi:DUF4232 domain-containing protein [Streptomyces sp. NPDC002018]|uniref:DUF4232 domain-containing protein n=1 Tax=Streptomyces sp. NPDC002018 TaxID=3364629 RepID=UPI0036963773
MAAAVVLLAVGTAACGGSGPGPGPGSDGSAAVGSAVTPSAGGTRGTPGASSAPPAPAAPDRPAPPVSATPPVSSASRAAPSSRCTADRLRLSLGPPDAGAGNIRYDLRLTNRGPDACTLLGFPGVSLLAGDGAPLGTPATREGPSLGAVRLAPGAGAEVTLHTLNRGIRGSSCEPAPSLLRIYPPGSKDAMTLRTSVPVVCGGTFTTTAVRPG